MPAGHLQLALPFPVSPSYDAVNFIAAGSNRAALAWLDRDDWPDRRLAVWGQAGCGKTHLVHLWARRHRAVLLTGPMLTDLAPVPEAGALAVDDASQVADETVLLHLLNTARDRGLAVLLADQAPPARWPVRLPDLGSRLRAITAVGIAAAEDELLRALLVRLLAERQLGIPQPVRDWLSRRLPRSAAALRDAVKVLDRESLESGSTITRPFAARVLHAAGLVADDRHEVSMAPPGATCQIPGML